MIFALHRRPLGYGLLLVDLAVRRPIDVLPDDESATLASWLREHPGAKVVAPRLETSEKPAGRLAGLMEVKVSDAVPSFRTVIVLETGDPRFVEPNETEPPSRTFAPSALRLISGAVVEATTEPVMAYWPRSP